MQQKSSTKQSRSSRTRNQRKREFQRILLMVAALLLMWIGLWVMLAKAWVEEEPVDGQEYLESIQADSVNYGSSKSGTVCQVICVPETAEAMAFFPVELDHDTQAFIIRSCEELNMEPAVIVAMIDQESDFRADCVGDSGASVGLMQVQPQWHQERMDKLGVTDLMNPPQNVAVGMDYMAELLDTGNGLEWALAAYNAGANGADKGFGFGYAEEVLAKCESLKAGVEDVYF